MAVCILHLFMSQLHAGLLYAATQSLNICASCAISFLLNLKINSCFEMQIPECKKDFKDKRISIFQLAVFIQRLNVILW